MKKRIAAAIIGTVIVLGGLMPLFVLPSGATGTHGLYLECRANVTNYKTDGFMIDFYSDSSEALATYWSNANWNMYTAPSVTKLGYNNITGGGAYAGLQYNNNDHYFDGIMSMWRWEYTDRNGETQYLYADTMVGNSTHYSHEGSGTSCIMPYAWQFGQWYRELLFCWDDEETGETFIGTWYYDYNADEWTLFTYYNTHLVDSYINTDVDQFLENYYDLYNNRLRNWRYRNVYFMPHGSTDWVSQPTVKMSTDYNPDAVGVFDMGLASDGSYVWGYVDGTNGQNVPDPNYQHVERTYTLNQPSKPTLGSVRIASFDVSDPANIRWTMAQNSTPQLAYELVLTDVAGTELARASGTRPEVRSLSFADVGTNAYKCTLTVRDVFGNTTTAEATTATYDAFMEHGNAEPVNYDDVDRNGTVNIGDVTTLLNVLSSSGSEYDADLDGDGVPNISDATLLLGVLSNAAVSRYSKGLIYTLEDGAYIVSGVGNCADTAIRIPQTYAGKSVTGIGAYAFARCGTITSVELPRSISSIGVYAFASCEAMTNITMPSSISSLGESAFAHCSSLVDMRVPEGIATIGKNTFADCASLESVTLPAALTRVYEGAFDGCEALESAHYTGTAWSRVRIHKRNDPLLCATVTFEKQQITKNGFVQEDGGVRYYIADTAQTGFKTFGERTYYFDPDTALMAKSTVVVDGTHYFFTSYEYDGITLWCLTDAEPDKETAPQAWLAWLIDSDALLASPTYRQLASGEAANATLYPGTNDPSPFDFHFNYRFNKSEIDLTENVGTDNYAYTWELWYRKARSGDDYACVRTTPYDVYDGDDPIYRLSVYEDGMTGLETDNGAPQEYEILFVIFEGGTTTDDIIGWKQAWVNYTDSAEAYRTGALVYYTNVTASSNMGAYGELSKADNILDGDQGTVCGQNYFNGMYAQIDYDTPQSVSEIFIQCKDEGTTTNADGSRGRYDVYAVYGGFEYEIAKDVPAVTGTDGGYTITLDEPVAAEGIKVYITSWQGDCWACVADLLTKVTGDVPEEPVPPEEFRHDDKGNILNMTASCTGFAGFGDLNKPENVLDGDETTVCGSGFDANAEQSVTVTFPYAEDVKYILVQCKNEGTTTNADGSRGTYDVYAILDGVETLIASGIPAITGPAGGYTITLDEAVRAKAIKVVITSWQGNCWACVADLLPRVYVEPAEEPHTDNQGYIINMTATCSGFAGFGGINDPSNVLDNNQSTVCGSGYNASVEQSVTVTFPYTENVTEVFVQCKDEGTTTHPDGKTRGTYDLYAVLEGVQTRIAQNIPARTGTDGGYTVVLDSPVTANAIKIVITSWQGSDWACVADVKVRSDAEIVETPHWDENGHILDMTATCAGFAGFGAINAPSNVLDGDQTTVCGSGFNASVEQSVTVTFPYTENVKTVFVQCKDEGTTTNPDGTRGTYDIYAVLEGVETRIAQDVPAVTGTDGGYTVTLDNTVEAKAIKVVITSWQGSNWACVADIDVFVDMA